VEVAVQKFQTQLLAAVFITLMATSALAAEQVYRSVDEDGVASFTDYPVPGAEPIDVNPVPANADRAKASAAMIEQQLSVAKALEDSRLARRKAETERAAARAASQPQTIYYPVERNTGGYWGWPGYGYRPPHRPEHPIARPPYRPGHPGVRPPFKPVVPPSTPIAPGPWRPGHSKPPSQPRPLPGG
jgi:hypothetical protein